MKEEIKALRKCAIKINGNEEEINEFLLSIGEKVSECTCEVARFKIFHAVTNKWESFSIIDSVMTDIVSLDKAKQMIIHSRDAETFPFIKKVDKGSKYKKNIKGIEVDVYDVIKAFGVECPARQHAIKKLLAAGKRGHKDLITDLEEAKHSIARAIELEKGE